MLCGGLELRRSDARAARAGNRVGRRRQSPTTAVQPMVWLGCGAWSLGLVGFAAWAAVWAAVWAGLGCGVDDNRAIQRNASQWARARIVRGCEAGVSQVCGNRPKLMGW